MHAREDYHSTIRNYERLAEGYDHKWRRYNKRTLSVAVRALRLNGSERILDVGCGTGEFERIALAQFPNLRIIGVDVTPAMLVVAKVKLAHTKSVSFQVASAEALPFDSETFDVVVLANMLHHMREPEQGIAEGVRVLRAGGQFVLVDWCRDFLIGRAMHIWFQWMERSGARIYRLEEVIQMVERLGLSVRDSGRFIAPPCYGMMWIAAEKPDVLKSGSQK